MGNPNKYIVAYEKAQIAGKTIAKILTIEEQLKLNNPIVIQGPVYPRYLMEILEKRGILVDIEPLSEEPDVEMCYPGIDLIEKAVYLQGPKKVTGWILKLKDENT